MTRADPQLKLRLNEALKLAITDAAAANRRSVNAEIVARLEQTFAAQTGEPSSLTGVASLPKNVSMGDLAEAVDRARTEATHRALRELGIVVRPFDADDEL